MKIGHRDGAHPMPNNIITSLADAPRNVPTWLDEVGIFNNILIIIRFYVACGRSNERPYWLDVVGIFNKSLIIIHLYDVCGRSNERPYGLVRIACGLVRGRHKARPLQLMWIYGLSVVRVFDDCAVGARCCVGIETVPLLCPTI